MVLAICFSVLSPLVYGEEEVPFDTLFNGTDLTGWTKKCEAADMNADFLKVENGCICLNSNGNHGWLWVYSDKEYEDFVLKLKFKAFNDGTGNSGVNFRSYFDQTDGTGYLNGPQVDIYPQSNWRTGLILDMTKGNERWLYPDLPNWNITQQPTPDGWEFYYETELNELEIRAIGTKITTKVNGVTVANEWDGDGVLNDALHKQKKVGEKGHIALQAHGDEQVKIYFKDIVIQDLSRGSTENESNVRFDKITLTNQYFTECSNYGDFDNDGDMDVCSGPSWYEGPEFTTTHPVYYGSATSIESWASNWHSYVTDMNNDGYDDILYITYVTQGNCTWYTNPKNETSQWATRQIFSGVDNEHAQVLDVDGDGKPEIVGCKGGYCGYATLDWNNPTSQATFHKISERGIWYANSHGIGVGDINGDGRNDILIKEGWFEQPASLAGDPQWTLHEFYFSPKQPPSVTKDSIGPAQLLVYDVNGDGRNDVVSAVDSHGWGLAWWENVEGTAGDITFERHMIMGDRSEIDTYGAAFSEPHAVALCDLDGDGLLDLVSGKRWWVHSTWGRDPEPTAAAVLYWFRLTRETDGTVKFTPHLIDSASGLGTEVVCADLNGDTYPDILAASKKGSFIFLQERLGTQAKMQPTCSSINNMETVRAVKTKNGSVILTIDLSQATELSVDLFSLKGEKISTIMDNLRCSGKQSIVWRGTNSAGRPLPRGLYLMHVKGAGALNQSIPLLW